MLMRGAGAKFVAHLMKYHLLQWKVVKVKFLKGQVTTTRSKVKSRSHHDIGTPTPPNQCP